MRRMILAVGVVCAIALTACGRGAGKGEPGEVLATVDGNPITRATLLEEAEGLPPYVRPILETPSGRARFLESVITRDLLLREALRRGLDRRPDVANLLANRRKSVLLEALLQDVASKAPSLSDVSLRRIYQSSRERFRTGPRVKVSHMLFRDRKRAEEMLRRARAGEPFEELMKEIGSREGEVAADLGDIERGKFVKEFEDAAFSAAPGSVVGPVKTVYGYHVIKVYSKKPAGIPSFEEIKPRLLAEQREMAQRDAFETLVEGLRRNSVIRIMGAPADGEGNAPPIREN